jgi:hypothetical protein
MPHSHKVPHSHAPATHLLAGALAGWPGWLVPLLVLGGGAGAATPGWWLGRCAVAMALLLLLLCCAHLVATAAAAVQAGGVMYYVQARVDPEPILAYRGHGVSNADWQQVT